MDTNTIQIVPFYGWEFSIDDTNCTILSNDKKEFLSYVEHKWIENRDKNLYEAIHSVFHYLGISKERRELINLKYHESWPLT